MAFIETLANTSLPSTDEAAARSLLNATSVAGQLQGFNWDRLKPLLDAEKQKDARGADAKGRAGPATGSADHGRAGTADRISACSGQTTTCSRGFRQPSYPVRTHSRRPRRLPQPTASGKRDVSTKADIAWVKADIEAFIDEHEGQSIVVEWRIEP